MFIVPLLMGTKWFHNYIANNVTLLPHFLTIMAQIPDFREKWHKFLSESKFFKVQKSRILEKLKISKSCGKSKSFRFHQNLSKIKLVNFPEILAEDKFKIWEVQRNSKSWIFAKFKIVSIPWNLNMSKQNICVRWTILKYTKHSKSCKPWQKIWIVATFSKRSRNSLQKLNKMKKQANSSKKVWILERIVKILWRVK